MDNVSIGDVIFIIGVLGIIFGCIRLARRAGKKGKPEDAK